MNRTAAALLEQAGAYAQLFDRVSVGGRFDEASSEGPVRLSSDQEVLEALATAAKLRRLIEAEETRLAGEIARRSENPDSSLAKRMGALSAANLVAQVTGVPRAQAGTMVASGQAFRTREAITGEPLPAAHPFVAAAFADGLLDPDVAAAVRRALDKAAPGLAPWEQDELERQVVAFSQEGWAADEFLAWLKQMPQHANPDTGKPNPDDPAPVETVTRKARPNGQFRWVLDLDALTDGFLKTAIDANTTLHRPILHTPDQPAPDTATEDRRPLEQRRVDGLRLLAKKALKVDDGQVGGTAVTLLVTTTEEHYAPVSARPSCRTAGPRSRRRWLGCLPPRQRSSPSCSAEGPNPSTSDSGAGSSPKRNDARWPSATAGAPDPAATRHPRGATGRTSGPPVMDAPRSRTVSCCAGGATSCSTCTGGRSNALTGDGGGPHHHGSIRPGGSDPAGGSHR